MNIVAIFLLSALTYSEANGCAVPTDNGGCCHFPFQYQGETYHQCTSVDSSQPWCSMTADYAGRWRICLSVSCGSKPAGTRIVGGSQAQRDSWPWQALLVWAGESQFCGGSLIHEQWVLTAAHCVDGNPYQIAVRMGAYNIRDTAQELQVSRIFIHESYSPITLAHDIALLKLSTTATLGAGVGTVCLPDENIPLEAGKTCYITGWGTLSAGGSLPDYLQQASVPIVSQQQCRNSYGSSAIHDSMLCAGLDAGGVDACQGDTGGPLVCEFNGKWYLEGATSWGYGCATPYLYGVYASVRYVKTWVRHTMASN